MPKVITGTWQNPDGSAVANGTLFLKLSQDAVAFGTAQLAPTIVAIQLDSTGSIPANTSIYANDELIPSGTGYYTSVVQKGGGRVYGPDLLFLTGSGPINLNNFTPQGTRIVIFNQQNFTSNGTFTIPTGITSVKVTVIGGGGGGGGGQAGANTAGSGGAAGAAAIKYLSGLTPGNTLAVTVGTGGAAGSGAVAAGNGTASSIASGTQTIGTVTANGGTGGGSGFGPQIGPTATGGDINFGGSAGLPATGSNNGQTGSSSMFGGSGAGTAGTGNGSGGSASGASGGGGGSGVGNTSGGAGAAGIVIFEWVQ